MNTTDLEIMPDASSQPARITRRTFVKRTSATVVVTVLALHAFRNEARADGAGGSSSSGPKVKLTKVSPALSAPEEAIHDSTNLSSSQRITAALSGKDVNYWNKVGEIRPSWSISLKAIGKKEPISSGGPADKAVELTYGYTIDVQGGKLRCSSDGGTDHKGDDPLWTGISINATPSTDGLKMTVTCTVVSGWSPGGSLTGVGLTVTTPFGGGGLTLAFSPASAPTVSITVAYEFELVP